MHIPYLDTLHLVTLVSTQLKSLPHDVLRCSIMCPLRLIIKKASFCFPAHNYTTERCCFGVATLTPIRHVSRDISPMCVRCGTHCVTRAHVQAHYSQITSFPQFKKEERVNMAQVDKALRTTCKWDAARLIDEFQEERAAADRAARAEAAELQRRAREHKQRQREARELRMRMSEYMCCYCEWAGLQCRS